MGGATDCRSWRAGWPPVVRPKRSRSIHLPGQQHQQRMPASMQVLDFAGSFDRCRSVNFCVATTKRGQSPPTTRLYACIAATRQPTLSCSLLTGAAFHKNRTAAAAALGLVPCIQKHALRASRVCQSCQRHECLMVSECQRAGRLQCTESTAAAACVRPQAERSAAGPRQSPPPSVQQHPCCYRCCSCHPSRCVIPERDD